MKSLYKKRSYFDPFHLRKHRFFYMVAHRRAGKTVAAVNDLIEKALYNTREAPRYGYVGPLLKQSKQIAWDYLKKFSGPFNPRINESELYVELQSLPNLPRITIYGADNPDAFRGLYFDGAVLDEFGNMRGSVFEEILLPALIDRNGWCVFMGTPNGPNHFRDAWYAADKQPDIYGKLFLPVTATGIISDVNLEMMKKMMDPEQYAQEMLCSFEASVRGAVYARQMELMQEEGRIGNFPFQKGVPIHIIMDLGWKDATAIGFFQERPSGILLGKAHQDNLKPIRTYAEYIKNFFAETGHTMGRLWVPHDARAKSLQTGKSMVQQLQGHDFHPRVVPNLDLIDGISIVRETFPKLYVNEPDCQDWILAAKSYHYKYDEELKTYSDEPVHDWSSHYMDMTRYGAIVLNPGAVEKVQNPKKQELVMPPGGGVHYGFALNDLWDLTPQRSSRL